jgi:hypothetical protein
MGAEVVQTFPRELNHPIAISKSSLTTELKAITNDSITYPSGI